ncbi:helix-turn-helix transcriptional regulator [Inquilinus sp. Marseille-Q2685]|uniref:helix-turn-helix transcriptional regulator n=1 Tax=Inquilinus sp. Marseille-Q2685 TaxID=2866581 RepID=UPI001CE452EE|nr:helix-turn-helix transcriptional regulator [Inquilinus sp. Marseille-Q2685]
MSGAVERIYDAALRPEGWTDGLDAVRKLVGAGHAVLLTREAGRPAAGLAVGVDRDPLDRLVDAAGSGGPAEAWLRAIPAGRVVASSSLMADADFLRTEMYNEIVRPMDGFRAGVFAWHGQVRSHTVAVCRPPRLRDFAPAELQALQLVMPHFAAAQRLRRRLAASELLAAESRSVLEALDSGVILVDSDCRPHFVNGRAAEIARRHRGLRLASAGVAAALPAETAFLRQLVAAMSAIVARPADAALPRSAAAASARLCLTDPEGGAPLVLTVVPVTAVDPVDGRCGPARAAIFLAAPDAARSVDERALVAAFGLTAREAEVAARLASGATIGGLAEEWGISANTVRGYLKAVFDKTGTHRQADLVRLVMQGFAAA